MDARPASGLHPPSGAAGKQSRSLLPHLGPSGSVGHRSQVLPQQVGEQPHNHAEGRRRIACQGNLHRVSLDPPPVLRDDLQHFGSRMPRGRELDHVRPGEAGVPQERPDHTRIGIEEKPIRRRNRSSCKRDPESHGFLWPGNHLRILEVHSGPGRGEKLRAGMPLRFKDCLQRVQTTCTQHPNEAPEVEQPKAHSLRRAVPSGHAIPQERQGPGGHLRRLRPQVFPKAMETQFRVRQPTQTEEEPVRLVFCPAAPDRQEETLKALQEAEPGGAVHRVIEARVRGTGGQREKQPVDAPQEPLHRPEGRDLPGFWITWPGGTRAAKCTAWWRVRDSNPRPPRCERGALPTELTPQHGTTPGRRDTARSTGLFPSRSPAATPVARPAQPVALNSAGYLAPPPAPQTSEDRDRSGLLRCRRL